jgi:thiol-disulfide isomerase/thioredoxin
MRSRAARRSGRLRGLGAAAALLLIAAGPAGAAEVGRPAPAFSASSLDGNGNLSLAQFKGKVVYLDFWASWCGPCKASLPMLEELRKELPADEFQILAVNVDKDAARARAFLARHAIGYPSASDPEGRVPAAYGLETMPSSYLIDRQGVLRQVHEGFEPEDMAAIRASIRAALEAK